MTTTLELPAELLTAFERRAARDGRDLSSALADLMRTALAAPEDRRTSPVSTDPKTGLPVVIGGPNATAGSMTARELLDLEQASLAEGDLERLGQPL